MAYEDKDFPLPVDHPKTAAILGVIYDKVFEPINRLIDYLSTAWTKKFVNNNTAPEDKAN